VAHLRLRQRQPLLRRIGLVTLLAAATLVGGFHEWAHPHNAQAAASCTITDQFDQTSATIDTAGNWVVVTNPTLTASCTTKWYVSFTPQCKTGHTNYQQCITNQLCQTAPLCTGNAQGWGAGTSHTYNETTQSPPGFTQSGNVCDYIWRIREVFRNGFDNTVIATAFSPEGFCT
jgi:hypothetical protein